MLEMDLYDEQDEQSALRKDAAAAWVVKLNAGKLSSEDAFLFEDWLHASDANRHTFQAYAQVWLDAGEAFEPTPSPAALSIGAIISAWMQLNPVKTWSSVAAACVLVLTLGVLPFSSIPTMNDHLAIHTDVGQSKQVEFSDGSKVQLNTDTGLEADYSTDERLVRLNKGEAHFVVAKDRSRPFRVYSGNYMIEAVGTAFRVFTGETTEVTVTEGQVKLVSLTSKDDQGRNVTAANTTVTLVGAGHSAVFSPEKIVVQAIDQAEVAKQLSWQKGALMFDGDPLEVAVREIARYTSTPIAMDDDIRQMPILGYFPVGDTGKFIDALQDNFNIAASIAEDGSIHLHRKPPGA